MNLELPIYIIIDNFPNIDFKKETEIYYMNSYVMNQIYNDWYNNYYLTNNTLNWVQLYEDSMYNNIKKLDTYITNGELQVQICSI